MPPVFKPRWKGLVNGPGCEIQYYATELLPKVCSTKIIILMPMKMIKSSKGTKYFSDK